MYFFLALVAIPIVFCMLAWALVTVHRLCLPHRSFRYRAEPLLLRPRGTVVRMPVAVGVREIREHQRRVLEAQPAIHYSYGNGLSHGVPECWIEDLRQRCN